jgi:hypothetical protein
LLSLPYQRRGTASLWDAVCGRVKPVPNEHHDPHIQKTWGWKDTSLDKRWWYYGKLLRKKATLVSLELLPFFYALSENYGDPDDYLQQYREGRLSHEAKQIYEALLEHGPQHVIELRRLARLRGLFRDVPVPIQVITISRREFEETRDVVGGGVAKSGQRCFEAVRAAARATAPPEMTVEIVPAALGDDAPLWGAVALAEDQINAE